MTREVFLYRIGVGAILVLNVYLVSSARAKWTGEPNPITPIREPTSERATFELSTLDVRPSAAAILRRNPFDSFTGPLDVKPLSLKKLIPPRDPLHASQCSDIVVSSTAEFEDPLLSTAMVRAAGETAGKMLRVGDVVSGARVAFIGFNPFSRSPAVWLERQGRLCQAELFRQEPVAQAAPPPPPKPKAKRSRRKRKQPGLPPEIAASIERVGPMSVRIDRSAVDTLLSGYATYMKGARIRPVEKSGRVVGMQVTRMRPSGLLSHLGFQPNDRIESVNGFRMTSPAGALAAYARLRTADQLRIQVVRGEKPVTLEIAIQ